MYIFIKRIYIFFLKGSDDGGGGADKLSMKNVGGIFVTILAGSGVAMVLGIVRWIKNIKKIARKYDVRLIKNYNQQN